MKRTFISFHDAFRYGAGACLALAVSGLLSGCTGAPRWGTWAERPTEAQVVAALKTVDQYAYFPGYEIYYNRTRGYYVFRTETGWVERFDLPAEIDSTRLLASPFVEMGFHDSPQSHHEEVARAYPRDWGQTKPHLALSR